MTIKLYVASACPMATVYDYSTITQDQKFKLVILLNPDGSITESSTLRNTYARSGLYRNDGTNSLIWTFDANQLNPEIGQGKLYTSDDGKHLVRFNPLGSLTFYEDGKLLKNYNSSYFEAPASLQCGTTWLKNESFDTSRQRLSIETNNSSKYEFDINTGNIISVGKTDPLMLLWIFLFVAVIIIPLIITLLYKRKSTSISMQNRG